MLVLVWILLEIGFVGLLDIMGKSVVEVSDTDLELEPVSEW